NLTGFNIVNYFSRNLDNILIGRYWGAQQLGLYDKAYQLLLLPLRQINIPISSVAVPGLSQLQLDPNRFRNYYLKTITCITFLTTPLITLFLIIADEIVILALGPQWRDASVIFQLLAISAVVQPLLQTTGWLYVATGRTDRQFKWGLLSALILNSSFFVGLPFGARGVAFSYAIAMFLQTYPCLYYATRGTSITIPDIIGAVWKVVVSALLAGGVTLAAKLALMHQLPMFPAAIFYSLIMACVYVGILFYLFNTKDFYLSVFHGLKRR
ncbi:MAG TPA: oligosaccharide flippase family protein, partial [Phormidium sp.]